MTFPKIIERIVGIGAVLTIPMIIWRWYEHDQESWRRYHAFGQQAAIAWHEAHRWDCILEGSLIAFGIATIWVMVQQFIETQRTENAERERARQADLARAKAHEAVQQAMGKELVKLSSDSLQWFESMPKLLLNAEQFLDQAECDFKENAFAPFWTSIEKATSWLGTFDDKVLSLSHSSERHGALATSFEGKPPSFPITMKSVQGMAAASTTADRLKDIVRKAQTNFQFAMIYEQRKTNQLLVAGFTNLAQALDGMGHRIAASINELSDEISAMSSVMQESFVTLGDQIQIGNQQVVERLNAIHTTSKQSASDVSERHDRTLEMLNNIQRRRMPTGFYAGIGTKPAP